jgi:hypothetical protein
MLQLQRSIYSVYTKTYFVTQKFVCRKPIYSCKTRSPSAHLLARDTVAISKFGRRGRGGRSAKPLLGDLVRRGRSGRGGKSGRPSPFESLRARCGRDGRGGSPRTPSLGPFVGVASRSRPVPLSIAFLRGLRRRELIVGLIRIFLGVSRDLAPLSSSSVSYSNESGSRIVAWG